MRVMAFGFGMLTCAILTFVATLIVVVCSGTLSLIAFFALYLGESIMFPTIFSLALRDAGTKTKLASSLLIMTIVGGAIAPVIMGYIADTTGSMAIAFLIPLVCYGVIGTYALSKPSVSLSQREVFSKTYPSFLTLKEGSTSHLGLLPSGKKRETALLGARNRYALRMADHQRSSPYFAGWDRLTIAC